MRLKFLVLCLAVGCASGLLAPEEVRQAEFMETVKGTSGTSYQKALRWLDRNLKFFPGGKRVQEPDEAHMRMRAATACNIFRSESDSRDYYLVFDLDFQAAQDAIHLHFTDLRMETSEAELVTKKQAQLTSVEDIEKVQPCLKKIVVGVTKAVQSNSLKW